MDKRNKKDRNILTKEQVVMINEKWFADFINKYKKEAKQFFMLLKKQFKYNANGRRIISQYMKNKEISKEDAQELKTIVRDAMKMVGLGTIGMLPVPGATALMILLIKTAKKLNIDIVPSQMKIEEPEEQEEPSLAVEKKKEEE